MRISLPLLLLLATPALAGPEERGVDSPNQPVVVGDRAYVPNCPNWRSAARDSAAKTDSNYGCAINSNMAAMVANARDLVEGRTDPATGRHPETAVRAIRSYRATQTVAGGAAPAAVGSGAAAAAAAPAAPR